VISSLFFGFKHKNTPKYDVEQGIFDDLYMRCQ